MDNMINQIIQGDCLEIMRRMKDESIDLTVTSPPYDNIDANLVTQSRDGMRSYNGYSWDFMRVANELYRITKQGGRLVWIVGDRTIGGSETGSSFRQALHFMSLGFSIETMIYEKNGLGAAGSMNYYLQAFEYMFVFTRGKPKTFNIIRDRKNVRSGKTVGYRRKKHDTPVAFRVELAEYGRRFNVWRYDGGLTNSTRDKLAFTHPAIFPEKLAQDHIISWSNEGDLILDPFVGSGTTCKMAALLNRNYIGIDISAEYCDLARTRIEKALKENSID